LPKHVSIQSVSSQSGQGDFPIVAPYLPEQGSEQHNEKAPASIHLFEQGSPYNALETHGLLDSVFGYFFVYKLH